MIEEHVDPNDRCSDDIRATAQSLADGPLPNVWLGVSVESKDYLYRIDYLRQTPAAVRFLSLEPLLEDLGAINLEGIDWVIVGGESGKGARPMHPDWVRSIRDQCIAAGVPFFFKQWGAHRPWLKSDLPNAGILVEARKECGYYCDEEVGHVDHGARPMLRVSKKKAGRLLDGREWNEMPCGQMNP
jgi:protein gp37